VKRILQLTLFVGIVAVVTLVVLQVRAQQGTGNLTGEQTTSSSVIDTTIVNRDDLMVTVTGTGSVAPARELVLRFEVTAPVAEVLVRAGQAVSEGDILARLDLADLRAALEDAQVAVEAQRVAYEGLVTPARDVDIAAAQASINSAYAAIAAASQGPTSESVEIARLQTEIARNQLWQSQLERDRTMEYAPQFRAGQTGAQSAEIQQSSGLAQAELQIQISEANYSATANEGPDQSALGAARAQLTQAEVALDRLMDGASEVDREAAAISLRQAELSIEQAQVMLDRGVLVAPFDGVIAQNSLVVGELPPQTGAAMLLLDTSGFHVDLTVDETDVVAVEDGQPASLRLEALGENTLDGNVTRVDVMPTVQGQLVTYGVRVAVTEMDPLVRAGMTTTATITTDLLEDVLVVPNRFVRIDRDTQRAYLTVQNIEGQYQDVEVTLGLRNDTSSQIVSGVNEGDTIVLLPRSTFNPLGG
jgi:HlyD family secretion protein